MKLEIFYGVSSGEGVSAYGAIANAKSDYGAWAAENSGAQVLHMSTSLAALDLGPNQDGYNHYEYVFTLTIGYTDGDTTP